MSKNFSDIFYRPVVFEEIERVVWPPSWLGHAPFALWLMESLKPQLLVELGTHTGNSFAAFCQGAKFLKYSPSLHAVDTWEGDPHAGLYGEEVFADVTKFFSSNYPDIAHLLRKTFNDALSDFADGSIDLLNIDGYHTYEATKENFETWLPKMSSRGVILIHDTNVHTTDFGAWKFWDEIKNKYPSFNFLHSHGLGVAVVGSEISESLQFLTQSDQTQTTEIQKFFSTLGATPVLKAEKEREQIKVADLERNCAEAHAATARERDTAAAWIAFVQQHLGPTMEAAQAKLEELGRANVEGIDYKLFVQRLLGPTLVEAEKKLIAERNQGLAWKNFVQGNLADDIVQAHAKLEALGKSNLEGLNFRSIIQRHFGQTVEEAEKQINELQSWRDLVNPRLGRTIEEAADKLDRLFEDSENMQSLGHKTVSFVNKKINRVRPGSRTSARKL